MHVEKIGNIRILCPFLIITDNNNSDENRGNIEPFYTYVYIYIYIYIQRREDNYLWIIKSRLIWKLLKIIQRTR